MNYLRSFAFATSPAHIDRGAAYEFVLDHAGPFWMTLEAFMPDEENVVVPSLEGSTS